MGSIRALYATVGRRKAFLDVTDGGLDALVPSSSIPSPYPKRQRGRGGSSHRGGHHKGKGMAGNGDDGPCRLSFCTKFLPPSSSGDTGVSANTASSAESATSSASISSTSSDATTATTGPMSGIQTPLSSSICGDDRSSSCTSATTVNAYVYRIHPLNKGKPFTFSLQRVYGSCFSSKTISILSELSVSASTVLPTLTSTPSSPAAESSGPPSISVQAAAPKGSKKTGAIAGGVLGGLAFILLLILGAILFLRRRRRKRTPASAEFRDRYIPRSTAPPPPLRHPLATQTSRESFDPDGDDDGAHDFAEMRYHPSEAPPPFTKGSFRDPLFEKIYETQQKNLEYGLAS
ncbi:hypothetical protein ACEPAG_5280 [Sanghuangporus baumii]